MSFYDEIEIEDFNWDPIHRVYHTPCPCGDRFEISKEQLSKGEDLASCPSCSLVVRVIYDWKEILKMSSGNNNHHSLISPACPVILILAIQPISIITFKSLVELLTSLSNLPSTELDLFNTSNQHQHQHPQQNHHNIIRLKFIIEFDATSIEHVVDSSLLPHQHLMGVIGIMDCNLVRDLSSALSGFHSKILSNYPKSLIARCFGFNPSDHHSDNLPGLILVPHIGNPSFYLNRLLAHFTSDLLQRLLYISSSLLETFVNLPLFPSFFNSISLDSTIIINTTSSDLLSTHKAPLAAPKARQPIHHLLSDPPLINPPVILSSSSSSSHDIPPLKSSSIPEMASNKSKNDKKLWGSIRKLQADLFLLSGHLSNAIKLYHEAINLLSSVKQPSNDHALWLASALDHLALTKLLDFATSSPQSNLDSSSSTLLLQSFDAINHTFDTFLKSSDLPIFMQAQAGLRLLDFLGSLWKAYHQDHHSPSQVLFSLAGLTHPPPHLDNNSKAEWDPSLPHSASQVSTTISKIYSLALHTLDPLNRIKLLKTLAYWSRQIGYFRKAAWFERELVCLIAQNLDIHQSNPHQYLALVKLFERICHVFRLRLDNNTFLSDPLIISPSPPPIMVNNHAQAHHHQNDSKLDGWSDLQLGIIEDGRRISEKLNDRRSLLRFSILKAATLTPTTVYNSSHQQDPLGELGGLLDEIPRLLRGPHKVELGFFWGPKTLVLAMELYPPSTSLRPLPRPATAATTTLISSNKLVDKPSTFFYAPNLQSNFTPLQTNKNQQDVVLVVGEPVGFLVTLQNPFLFEIDLMDFQLSTSGSEFNSIKISTISLPPSTIRTIKVFGIPLQPGQLVIRGCKLKLIGSSLGPDNNAQQEFILPSLSRGKKAKNQDELIKCTVTEALPVLKVRGFEGAVAVLEGEKVQVEFEIENVSEVDAEWIQGLVLPNNDLSTFSHQHRHHHQPSLKNSSEKKEQTDAERYEREYDRLYRPILKLSSHPTTLLKHASRGKVVVECFGKVKDFDEVPSEVVMRYGISQSLMMRELKIPITVSVKKVLEIVAFDIVENSGEKNGDDDDDKCAVRIKVFNRSSRLAGGGRAFEIGFVDSLSGQQQRVERVEPESIVSIMTLIPKISLSRNQVEKPIPSLDSTRQFIISSMIHSTHNNTSRTIEKYLKAFWVREAVLELIKVYWIEIGSKRNGEVDIRKSIKTFKEDMVRKLFAKPIHVKILWTRRNTKEGEEEQQQEREELDLLDLKKNKTNLELMKKKVEVVKVIKVGEFVEVVILLTNRSEKEICAGICLEISNKSNDDDGFDGFDQQQQLSQLPVLMIEGLNNGIESIGKIKPGMSIQIKKTLIGLVSTTTTNTGGGSGIVKVKVKVWDLMMMMMTKKKLILEEEEEELVGEGMMELKVVQ